MGGKERRRITKGDQFTAARISSACVEVGSLDGLPMTPELRIAVSQARSYDQAVSEYPGFLASRRNSDVAQGVDNEGQWRSGVLEASWRSGGASTAELM